MTAISDATDSKLLVDVVGGSGFIGTRLCRRFEDTGVDYQILDKTTSQIFPGRCRLADVRSIEDLSINVRQGATIINLAAEHRDDVRPRTLYEQVNVLGAKNLCAVARRKSVTRIVFTSSVAVYGFAKIGTDELGSIQPFNDYGRTKYEAEDVFREWQAEAASERSLIIIRPTVVFGEGNRGNVYNLLRQIASRRFVMVGPGDNRKSMAYVENVAAFLQHSLTSPSGVHVYNFVDKPDFAMNQLVSLVRELLGIDSAHQIRVPYPLGYAIGVAFDGLSAISGKKFGISSIRVKKFCANSVYETSTGATGFVAPVTLIDGLKRTIAHEFLRAGQTEGPVYYTE